MIFFHYRDPGSKGGLFANGGKGREEPSRVNSLALWEEGSTSLDHVRGEETKNTLSRGETPEVCDSKGVKWVSGLQWGSNSKIVSPSPNLGKVIYN